jgi:ribosome-associated protein
MSHHPMAPTLGEDDVVFTAIRSQGPGGQNVNKVATAAHLRFEVAPSPLPEDVKARLLTLAGSRATKDAVIVIKAQRLRTQEQNRADALERLNALLAQAWTPATPRKPTKPTYGSRQRRLKGKAERSAVKQGRAKPVGE